MKILHGNRDNIRHNRKPNHVDRETGTSLKTSQPNHQIAHEEVIKKLMSMGLSHGHHHLGHYQSRNRRGTVSMAAAKKHHRNLRMKKRSASRNFLLMFMGKGKKKNGDENDVVDGNGSDFSRKHCMDRDDTTIDPLNHGTTSTVFPCITPHKKYRSIAKMIGIPLFAWFIAFGCHMLLKTFYEGHCHKNLFHAIFFSNSAACFQAENMIRFLETTGKYAVFSGYIPAVSTVLVETFRNAIYLFSMKAKS